MRMPYTAHDIVGGLALAGLFGLVLLANDFFVERRIQHVLQAHPEIVTNAIGQDQERRATAMSAGMKHTLLSRWSDLSKTRVYAVRYNGKQFESRLARIADIAATAGDLNLVATDYRCAYCRSDRHAVDAWLRSSPNQEVAFLEAPLLGPESAELAKEVLRRTQADGVDYYRIHNSEFERAGNAGTVTEKGSGVVDALLAEQKRFAAAIGIFATPTYIRAGVVRSGAITHPAG
jgi:hypothetical protein